MERESMENTCLRLELKPLQNKWPFPWIRKDDQVDMDLKTNLDLVFTRLPLSLALKRQ